MKTIARLMSVVLGGIPAILLLLFVAGNTAPTCGTVETEEPVCTEALDCEGLPHIDCEGSWGCADGQCTWDCSVTPPPPTECTQDSDCGKGFVCELSGCANTCLDGQPCPAMCEVVGKCVAVVEPVKCGWNEDCPAGQHCSNMDGDCLPPGGEPADCPDGMACIMMCFGVCVDDIEPVQCFSDADCGPGEICQYDYNDLCLYGAEEGDKGGSDAGAPMFCGGVCVPAPQPECYSDYDCGPGFICQFPPDDECWYGGSSDDPAFEDMKKACGGVCVPGPQPECYSDYDCGPGFICEFPLDGCWYGDENGDGAADEALYACAGVCVPAPTECSSDLDCGPGFICEMVCTGCKCSEGDKCPGCETVCTGTCVPGPQPECFSDYDCPAGYICQMDPDSFCWYEGDGEGAPAFCGGVCVPAPTECSSDWDCGPGFICEVICTGCKCDDGEKCPGCETVCTGTCVPDPQPGCESNADCGPGEVCEIMCVGCACPEGMDCDCIDWCEGTCVQVQPVECWSDYDCPAGFICQYSEDTNCWYGDGNGDGLYNCGGVCVPGAVDCFSDADCAPGFACQYDPDSYCWYEGDEDEPQSDMPAYCGGICVPKECKPVPCPAGFVFDQASCECVNVQNTCVVSGCSGEVCGSVPIATNCIWEPWFICYSQQFTTCGPYGPDGTCMWEPTAEFYACMSQFFG